MVKHIIIWNLKDEFSKEEKENLKAKIKTGLESLNGKIPGMKELTVRTDFLAGSNGDILLDALFEDSNALAGYQKNPLHLKEAEYVRNSVASRKCVDFEI